MALARSIWASRVSVIFSSKDARLSSTPTIWLFPREDAVAPRRFKLNAAHQCWLKRWNDCYFEASIRGASTCQLSAVLPPMLRIHMGSFSCENESPVEADQPRFFRLYLAKHECVFETIRRPASLDGAVSIASGVRFRYNNIHRRPKHQRDRASSA